MNTEPPLLFNRPSRSTN